MNEAHDAGDGAQRAVGAKRKTIVICCDGTNNQIERSPTNVFRLFQALDTSDPDQVAVYIPGVGTMASPSADSPIQKRLSLAFGLAFGVGLQQDYEDAYRFLMQEYEPNARIFIFGFSRGALTARAVAGMVHMFGLLSPGQENLVPYVARHYAKKSFEVMREIRRFARTRVKIDFLGLWDTVTSYGFAYSRRTLPYTRNNRDVKVIRHALALDEKRAYFRANRVGDKFVRQAGKDGNRQDVREVWFPGVHSDVGGGYEEPGLARITLEWMIAQMRERPELTLSLDDAYLTRTYGAERGTAFTPDPTAPAHESLRGAWWVLELLPKNKTMGGGVPLPQFGRRRHVLPDPDGTVRVHQSVIDRMGASEGRYAPSNLPVDYVVEPWSNKPGKTKQVPNLPGSARASAITITASVALLLVLGFFAVAAAVNVVQWALVAPRSSVIGLFVIPYGVLAIGGWLMGLYSRLPRYKGRLDAPLPHARFDGYDVAAVNELTRDLGPDGVAAYHRSLGIDLFFPFVYGPALYWTLHLLATLILPAHWLWQWALPAVLPLVTMIADWIENTTLLEQVHAERPPEEDPIRTASLATRIKLFAYGACMMIPPLAWILVETWRSLWR